MSDEVESDPMTPAQRVAIQKAWDILTEHFERVLVVADWDCEGDDGEQANAHEGWWHGGALAGVGLAEFAKDRMLKSGRKYNDPNED